MRGGSDRPSFGTIAATAAANLLAVAALALTLSNGDDAAGELPAGSASDGASGISLVKEIGALRGELSDLQHEVAGLRKHFAAIADTAPSATRLDRIGRELAVLRQQVHTLQASALVMPMGAEADERVADASGPVVDPAADLEEMAAAEAEYYGAIDARLMDEARDPAWSVEAEDTVDHAFRSPELAGVQLEAVDCRSSLCRVDVWLEDGSQELEMLLMPFVAGRFERVAIEASPAADGRRTVYLARYDDGFGER